MKTLLILGIFHIIGDYYLQSANLAIKKENSKGSLLIHAALYAFSMGIVFLCAPFVPALISWAIISLTHLIIDTIRISFDKKHEKLKLLTFVIDQCIHLLIIFGCFMLFLRFRQGIIQQYLYTVAWFRTLLVYISIFSIIIKPTAVFISKVFIYRFPQVKNGNDENKDIGTGTWIGILERIIVVTLVLLNAPSAIGFVLTAKSIARFKQLDDREFAERYIVGTLLSVGIALAATLLITKIV